MKQTKIILASALLTLIAHNPIISMGSNSSGSSSYPPRNPQQEQKETENNALAQTLAQEFRSIMPNRPTSALHTMNHNDYAADLAYAQALQAEYDAQTIEQPRRSISPTYHMVQQPTASAYLAMHRQREEDALAKQIESMICLSGPSSSSSASPQTKTSIGNQKKNNSFLISSLLEEIRDKADIFLEQVRLINEKKMYAPAAMKGMEHASHIFKENPKKIMELMKKETPQAQALIKEVLDKAQDKVRKLEKNINYLVAAYTENPNASNIPVPPSTPEPINYRLQTNKEDEDLALAISLSLQIEQPTRNRNVNDLEERKES